MKQQTLAAAADQNAAYERYRRPTKRDVFLATMEQIVPWAELCSVIEPHYPKPGNGRPPVGLERMLRMYFVHVWTRRPLQVLLDDGKWSAHMYSARLGGSLCMPAASMRFARPVLNSTAA